MQPHILAPCPVSSRRGAALELAVLLCPAASELAPPLCGLGGCRAMWDKSVRGMMDKLVHGTNTGFTYVAELDEGSLVHKVSDPLSPRHCTAQGVLLLASLLCCAALHCPWTAPPLSCMGPGLHCPWTAARQLLHARAGVDREAPSQKWGA